MICNNLKNYKILMLLIKELKHNLDQTISQYSTISIFKKIPWITKKVIINITLKLYNSMLIIMYVITIIKNHTNSMLCPTEFHVLWSNVFSLIQIKTVIKIKISEHTPFKFLNATLFLYWKEKKNLKLKYKSIVLCLFYYRGNW